jgi:molybdopterin converting factor subunit 1
MTNELHIYKVLLFGALKDAARVTEIEVQAADGISLEQLMDALRAQYPALQKYFPHVRIAVNFDYTSGDITVRSSDEIALIPPVAGG